MARMVFGPWVRPFRLAGPNPNEFYDVTATCGHPNWIKAENIEQAKWLPSPAKWVRPDGSALEYKPAYIRRRDWVEPADIEVPGSDRWNSVGLELNQDGSVTLGFATEDQSGRITIPACELESVAQWFTKAVEANKQ